MPSSVCYRTDGRPSQEYINVGQMLARLFVDDMPEHVGVRRVHHRTHVFRLSSQQDTAQANP